MLKNNKWMKASALTAILAGSLLTACGGDSGGGSGGGSGSIDIIYPTENMTITKKTARDFVVSFSNPSAGNRAYFLNDKQLEGVFSGVKKDGKATAKFAELKKYISEGHNDFFATDGDGSPSEKITFTADLVSGAVIITSVGAAGSIPTAGNVTISGVTRQSGLQTLLVNNSFDLTPSINKNSFGGVIEISNPEEDDGVADFTFVASYEKGEPVTTYIAGNGRKFNSLGALQIPSDAGDQWLKDLILAGGLSDIDDASDAVIIEWDGPEDVSGNTLKPTIDVISTTDNDGDTFIKLSGGVEVVVGPNGAGSIQPALGSFMNIQEPNFNEYGDLGDSGIKLALSENMLNQQIMALYQSGMLNEMLYKEIGGARSRDIDGKGNKFYYDVEIFIKSVPSVRLSKKDNTLSLSAPQVDVKVKLSEIYGSKGYSIGGVNIASGETLIHAIIDMNANMNLTLGDDNLPVLSSTADQIFVTIIELPEIVKRDLIELALKYGQIESLKEYESIEDLKVLLESTVASEISTGLNAIGASLINSESVPKISFDIEKLDGIDASAFREGLKDYQLKLNVNGIEVNDEETYILFSGKLNPKSDDSKSLLDLNFCSSFFDPDSTDAGEKSKACPKLTDK